MGIFAFIRHLRGGHASVEFLEFRISMKPLIGEIRTIETDLNDVMTELKDIADFKGRWSDKWTMAIVDIDRIIKSYHPLIAHMEKWGISVKDEDLPKYKKELIVILEKSLSDLNKAFNEASTYLIILRSDSIKRFGEYKDETKYTQGALNKIRELKRKINTDLTKAALKFANQK